MFLSSTFNFQVNTMRYAKCTITFWFIMTVFSAILAAMIIVRSMPSKEMQCLIVNNTGELVACVTNAGLQCFTPNNFAFTLIVDCSGEIFNVFAMEQTYCICCNTNCINYFESSTLWAPFTVSKYRILEQDVSTYLAEYQLNTTKSFFKSNGIMYLSKLEYPGMKIVFGCFVGSLFATLASLTGYMIFGCRNRIGIESESTNSETVELVSFSQN